MSFPPFILPSFDRADTALQSVVDPCNIAVYLHSISRASGNHAHYSLLWCVRVFTGLCKQPQPDEVAEWLRRWTANPLCSARVGSNPILVGK